MVTITRNHRAKPIFPLLPLSLRTQMPMHALPAHPPIKYTSPLMNDKGRGYPIHRAEARSAAFAVT